MASYGYQPRSFLVDPSRFGHPDAEWAGLGDPADRWRRAAAFRQHKAALLVRDGADDDTLAEIAGAVGQTVDTLRRKLRGESPIKLYELMTWVGLVGVDVFPVIDDTGDVEP